MAEEKVFFDENGIKVTSARFICGGKTHSMAGVTSVEARVIPCNRKPPIILAVLGIIIAFFHWFGFVLIAAGAAWLFLQKKDFVVYLSSASGGSDAYINKNESFIDSIVSAVNDAIVHRG